jgi:raffinose/stachyose/melibiose transport system substrate-binding protein
MKSSWRPRGLGSITIVVALIACVGGGVALAATSSKSSVRARGNPFAHYGNITLNVWSADNQDPGPKPVIEALAKSFHARYPTVSVKLKFYGLTDYLKIIQLALNSGNAPDVAEGNQGYGTDALLVKAKLIRPLNAYARKYHWNKYFPPGAMAQFRWSTDGNTYGRGNIYGVGQFGQSVGVFYNKTKLKQAGVDPNKLPKTFAAFNRLLARLRPKVPSSQPLIVIGNKSGYESMHSFGMLQGAYVTGSYVRNWIFHAKGANYNTPANVKALALYQQWFKANYFGNDYNAVDENEAAAAYAKGKGVFYLGGNWQAQVIREGLGKNVGFVNMPPGPSGKYVAVGATSLPWHVSSKSKYPDVGAAFINWLIAGPKSAKLAYSQNQVPAILGASAPPKGNAYMASLAKGWQQLVRDNGLTLYPDWAADTMFQYLGSQLQELMAGRIKPGDMARNVQANWEAFDKRIHKK